MLPRLIIIIWILSFSIFDLIYGQTGLHIDSLLHALEQAHSDQHRASLHEALAKDLIYVDLNRAEQHLDTMLSIATKIKDVDLERRATYHYSVVYRLRGAYEKAIELQYQYVEQMELTKDTLEIAQSYYQLGASLLRLDRYEEASTYLLKARDYAEEIPDYQLGYKVLNGLAILYKNLYQHDQSLEAYQTAVKYSLQIGDTASLAIIYNGIGILYKDMDSLHLALPYFVKGLTIAEKSGNRPAVANHSRNIGLIHFQQEDYMLAEQYHRKALQIRQELGTKLQIGGSYNDLGEVFMAQGKLKQAEFHFLAALDIFTEIKALASQNYIHNMLATLYQQKGNYALSNEYLNRYFTIRDSLKDNELREKISELNIQYETARKDQHLAAQRLTIAKSKSQRNIFMFGAFTLLAISWFLIFRFRQHRILARARIDNLEKQQKLIALDYMVQGQEEERKRIARDLHDGLGSLLASVRHKLATIHDDIDALSRLNVSLEADKLVRKAYDEVRRISHDMMPASLLSLGLVDALEDLVSDLRSEQSLHISFRYQGNLDDISDKLKLNVYRLVQEISTNTLKHAQATELIITLEATDASLELTVIDNGQGFTYDESSNQAGIGLTNIKSRVKYLEGEMVVDTAPGKGTQFHMVFPLEYSR